MSDPVRIGGATLYHADNRALMGDLCAAAALVTDPPYGINYSVNARTWSGRSLKCTGPMTALAQQPIAGDDQPFDPQPWLYELDGVTPRRWKVAFFGAHHFASRLPAGGSWLVWDKRRDSKPDDHGDGDLVWLGAPGVVRIHRQLWRGVCREGEENCSRSKKLHPNQKPVLLIRRIFDALGLQRGQTVADPYMGSGSTGVVALRLGMNFIGCESDSKHFDTACRRLEAEQAGLPV